MYENGTAQEWPSAMIATWWCHLQLQGSKVCVECQGGFGKWWQVERIMMSE